MKKISIAILVFSVSILASAQVIDPPVDPGVDPIGNTDNDLSFQCRLENSGGNQAVYIGYEHWYTFGPAYREIDGEMVLESGFKRAVDEIYKLMDADLCTLDLNKIPICRLDRRADIYSLYLDDTIPDDEDFYHNYGSFDEALDMIEEMRHYEICL